jgi:hypothetical protein
MDTQMISPGADGVAPLSWQPTEQNRYYYYEFLHFIPTSKKDKYWAAQCLLFNKLNSSRILDVERVNKYRMLDQGIIDKMEYVKIIDPATKDGGGKASYFTASWQSNPINLHVQNILDARLQKMPIEIAVNAVDEYFQLRQQKENAKIMGRKIFFKLLNDMNTQLGLPPLRPGEDPYKYVARMAQNAEEGRVMTKDANAPQTATRDTATQLMDNIRSLIEDDEDLAMFNTYAYKDGVEVACELIIKYYQEVNKFTMVADNLLRDLRNFNCTCLRYYTSQTTGRPVLRYEDPAVIFSGPFQKEDGSDCPYWWTEYDITFAEFVRQFGANLTKDQLKIVFDRNRATRGGYGGGGSAGVGSWGTWDECTPIQREQALIRVGYSEWQTQNISVYSEGNIRGNLRYKRMEDDWEPPKGSPYKKDVRYYNMWYKCYYIPTFVSTTPSTVQTSDFDLQKHFIFEFGPIQDQLREGEDARYSRSSLVLWRSKKASWTDVEQRYMPSINLLWQQAQNDLANVIPHGLWFSEEAFTELMEVVDEAQKDGKDSNGEAVRRLKQTGYGIGKLFDDMGRRIPPFVDVKTGHLESAREKMIAIMDLYTMMTRALAFNEIDEGQAPAPRQSATGIQLAVDAAHNGTYFIEKAYVDLQRELAYRLLNYCKDVANEEDSGRYQEMCDIVGNGTAWALESVKDIPWRRLGLTVSLNNTEAQQALINQMALEMSRGANPILAPDEAIQLTFIDNVKYKYALLRLQLKKRQKMLEQQQAAAAQQQQQMLMLQQQIEQQKNDRAAQARFAEIELNAKIEERLMTVEAQLKYMSQRQLKEQIKDNRIEQDAAAAVAEQNAEAQAPMV